MMDLDPFNNLDKFPLKNLDQFLIECNEKNIYEINITGSNTDPLLYKYTEQLRYKLDERIPGLIMGVRTNGAAYSKYDLLKYYNKGSITICSTEPDIYLKMMGKGIMPDIEKFLGATYHFSELKVNIVLGPENFSNGDVLNTIQILSTYGIKKFNLREPYGQPHVGDPIAYFGGRKIKEIYGMPTYEVCGSEVVYWDVHYVEVESINLYANGNISYDYPITRGHSENGKVLSQDKFEYGRHNEQWIKI
ncbi:hypothetical protein [Leptospira johnsonii]|nr:hypothetical protein [Leptospira johnsonii]